MLTVKNILQDFPEVWLLGNTTDVEISQIVSLDENNQHANFLSWCSDKNLAVLSRITQGIIIVSEKINEISANKNCNYIVAKNPRLLFSQVIKKYFMPKEPISISSSAKIASDSKIGKDVFIGENVVIETGCVIGDFSSIGHNTILHKNTQVGNQVKIGCNNTIGGVGFGYEKNETGENELIPHIGNVVIHDEVEIGNNTCIDRAVLGSTILKKNVKVDNLVHIAHGVIIGENSLIIANSMIGGSARIGKNVWVAPTASIINKAIIHDDSLIGMGAVVVKEVAPNSIVAGNPARFLKNK